MSENISPAASARREAARVSGRFGAQVHSDPEVIIYPVGTVDEDITAALNRKAARVLHAPGEKVEASSLNLGDEVLTETNTTDSPFSYAIRTNREVRRSFRDAGMPWKLTVTGRRHAQEDGDTDEEVTFDLDGQPLTLTFHRGRSFTIAH